MKSSSPLRFSTASVERPYQAGKWLTTMVLLDLPEMKQLLEHLENPLIYLVGSCLAKDKGQLSQEVFLNDYNNYIQALKQGEHPQEEVYRNAFAAVWTTHSDHLYRLAIGEDKELVRIQRPVIQLQPHYFDYSPYDDKVRSHVLGKEAITWGVQFSYPQMFQDPTSQSIQKVIEGEDFPNTVLFKKLQRWIRHHTTATPLIIGDKKIYSSIRLGKECYGWINCHLQLIKKGYRIDESRTHH